MNTEDGAQGGGSPMSTNTTCDACPACLGVPEEPGISGCEGCWECDFTGTREAYEAMLVVIADAHASATPLTWGGVKG